ncbi:MAG: hypothetical protein N2053_05475 [Chitinispirillaceae bacterium]|nr:hypothetical protein [Chitinispirillaceae bacterium]
MAGKEKEIIVIMPFVYINITKKEKGVSLLLFFLILITSSYSKDVLIIANPALCRLYDQYEQLMPLEKKKEIVKNAPFEIVNEKRLMGDQITDGIQLSLLGVTYYLLLDEKGKIAGVPPSAGIIRYRGCDFFYDTVRVIVSSVKVYSDYTGNVVCGELRKNDIVIKVFTYRDKTFVYFIGHKIFTGWVKGTTGIFGSIQQKKSVKKEDEFTEIHTRIVKKLNEANNSYKSYFEYFNKITGMEKSIPQWIFYEKERKYVLTGSKEIISQLSYSTEYLINEIKKMVEGRKFGIIYNEGVISVVEAAKIGNER